MDWINVRPIAASFFGSDAMPIASPAPLDSAASIHHCPRANPFRFSLPPSTDCLHRSLRPPLPVTFARPPSPNFL